MLRALIRLWQVDPADPGLARVAEALGADVPVCLLGRSAFVGGIGEDLSPAPSLNGLGLVLVNPGLPVSTAEVFRTRHGAFSSSGQFADAPEMQDDLVRRLASLSNDLTAPAMQLCPSIRDVLEALEKAPECRLARMSGSGPTCFGLFPSRSAASWAAELITARNPVWWVHAGHFV